MIEDGVDGLLVPQEDVAAIEVALKRLLNDPQAAASISAAARSTALVKFDYRTNAGLLLEQIENAMGADSRSA